MFRMRIDVIPVPYDSGHRGVRMGRGPDHLLQQGLEARLRGRGHEVFVTTVESQRRFPTEVSVAFELYAEVARLVAAAVKIRSFPLVLSGNCGAAAGAFAPLGSDVGLIWFDAHGDYMTPETTRSGFLDGMAISFAAGKCWHQLTSAIPGFQPVDVARIAHVGAREWDPGERERFEADGGSVITPREVQGGAAPNRVVSAVGGSRALLHVDLDVLDCEVAIANPFACGGGITVGEVCDLVAQTAESVRLEGAVFASFDPAADPQGRGTAAALAIIDATVNVAQKQRTRPDQPAASAS